VLLYRELCSIGGQLQRLLSLVRREQVHVIVFDDFIGDTKAEYRKALAHLGVEDDGRQSFPVMNAAKRYTQPRVYHQFVRVRNTLKRALRISSALGIGSVLRSALTAARERHEVPDRVKDAMIREFTGDVRLLETILERDLSSWFKQ
jgi:hypothetical protein